MTVRYEALLRRAMQRNEVVSIHHDPRDFDSIYCGYVESLNALECRMRVHRLLGMADGWLAIRLADVHFVDTGGKYEHRLAYFAATGGHLFPFPPLARIEDGPILHGTLRQARELGLLVNLRLTDNSYIVGGFVHELGEGEVAIAQVDVFGAANGTATVGLENVLYVTCGSMECQRTQHLAERQEEYLAFCRQQTI